MKIGNIAHQPPAAEPENNIKATSSDKPSAETAREDIEHMSEALVANKSSLSTLPKGPIGDPLFKTLVLEKLGAGSNASSAAVPSIRMDKKDPEDPSGTGWDVGSDAPQDDLDRHKGLYPEDNSGNEGSGREVGFNLSARPHFLDGDGHSKNAASGTAGSSTTQSGTTGNTGTNTTNSQSSTTSKPPVKKK
jgi:hypothetical protein